MLDYFSKNILCLAGHLLPPYMFGLYWSVHILIFAAWFTARGSQKSKTGSDLMDVKSTTLCPFPVFRWLSSHPDISDLYPGLIMSDISHPHSLLSYLPCFERVYKNILFGFESFIYQICLGGILICIPTKRADRERRGGSRCSGVEFPPHSCGNRRDWLYSVYFIHCILWSLPCMHKTYFSATLSLIISNLW